MHELRLIVQRDCIGGERIIDIEFPRGIERENLDRVEGVGTRVVLEDLPQPLFRLDVPGRFLISGVLSARRVRFTVRMALRDAAAEVALAEARNMLGEAP